MKPWLLFTCFACITLTGYCRQTVFVIQEKDLIPEGITYDSVKKEFFIGSIYKRKIISADSIGKVSDFVPLMDSLGAYCGIHADSKRRLLWAVSNNAPFFPVQEAVRVQRFTSIVKFDIDSRQLLKQYVIKDTSVVFNDLCIDDSNGDVYITDSYSGSIYYLNYKQDYLSEYLARGSFTFPNGIAINNSYIFIAAQDNVYKVDKISKRTTHLSKDTTYFLGGIDGLCMGDSFLIGIQNGVQPRQIIKIDIDNDMGFKGMLVLEAKDLPRKVYSPTTGVVINNMFYFIKNAQVRSFDENGNIFPLDKLEPVTISSLKIY